jgi:hypothetical protein
MELGRCSQCGAPWGSYTPGQQSHYCTGGRRVFRSEPSESAREQDNARRRDPAEQQKDNDDLNEAYRRGG